MRALLLTLLGAIATFAGFTGTYKGAQNGVEFTLDLSQEGSKVTGKATGGGATFKLDGTANGQSAEGTLTIEGLGEKMFFRANLSDAGLVMKIAEPDENGKAVWAEADTIDFKRVDKPSEPTGGKLSKHVKAPIETLKSGKEYIHASGGKFRYPSNWTLKESDDALILTPPDAAAGEVVLVLGDKAEGVTDPASPEVVSYLDETVKSLLPTMKRVGGVEKAAAGSGKGAFLVWEGDVDGKPAQVRAYVTILKGYGIALVAAGPKDAVAKRDGTLREIFYTFGWGQGKRDDRLVGTWKHWSYKAASGTESTATAVLNGDGTFSYASSSETSANVNLKNQYGDQTAWGAMYGRSGSGWKGTWSAGAGELTLNFEDGSIETFDYEFKQEGANTFLVVYGADRSKPMEWSRG